ncbi:MAG TPA: hypothetical protein PLB25_00070 [Rhodoferax sp.]|nr:hypothetical protein [Rhodoferax sp.]
MAILSMTLLTMLVVLVTMLTIRIIQSMLRGQTCVPGCASKDQRGAGWQAPGFGCALKALSIMKHRAQCPSEVEIKMRA